MIERGYNNVKTVEGGGGAMEKYFTHFKAIDGGRLIDPMTGTVVPYKPMFK